MMFRFFNLEVNVCQVRDRLEAEIGDSDSDEGYRRGSAQAGQEGACGCEGGQIFQKGEYCDTTDHAKLEPPLPVGFFAMRGDAQPAGVTYTGHGDEDCRQIRGVERGVKEIAGDKKHQPAPTIGAERKNQVAKREEKSEM
ncbi:hypothetical protein GMPD_02570 [Geomonas paludis]|uniref:Uncharacterized protein n=1 Tax=Geomonas paludis TaxID=2740185 RepID=A0A6V8MQJ7_9BACT|nr:hypothetical protein GMPD_02570 [Geomonas paludis]